MNRPLLLLDIDGVISLFGFDHARPPEGQFVSVDGTLHLLSTEAAEQVLALADGFELAWCSGWEERADEHLPRALGLPAGLPHLVLDLDPAHDGRHWKLGPIDRFAGPDRPLAWVDDGHNEECRAWAADRPGPTLLISTDPATGLTAAHARLLTDWAQALNQSNEP